jgi:hypothetical protein
MSARFFIIIVIPGFISCSDEMKKEPADHIDFLKDTTFVQEDRSTPGSFTVPSRQFLDLVKQIDSSGFIWDTARIKKVVHYFRDDSIIIAENYVFYKMKPEHSYIIEFYNTHRNDQESSFFRDALIKKEYFDKAISIVAYYYRQKEKSDLITDGFIEEWRFPTPRDAENALRDVDHVKAVVFFNTESFTCRIAERVYVFHVRASGFSIQLKKFFQRFVKNNSAIVPK